MSEMVLKDRVDPRRFKGKMFTGRNTFRASDEDYSIMIDGLTAGRIMKKILPGEKVVWFWTLTGPYCPDPKSHDGQEDTFEAACDAFKKTFWQWQAWALQQMGKATWYAHDE